MHRTGRDRIAKHGRASPCIGEQEIAIKRKGATGATNVSFNCLTMNLDELYSATKKRRSGLKADQFRHKRTYGDRWRQTQAEVYRRDQGLCQSPLQSPICTGKSEPMGTTGHIDHIQPLVCGGSNHVDNLRLLCPVCHALRLERHHEGLRGKMLKLNQLPDDWRSYLWEG